MRPNLIPRLLLGTAIAFVGVLVLATAYAENPPPNVRTVPPPEPWPAPPPPPKHIWAIGTNVVITGGIEANDYAVFVDTVLPETKTVYLNSPGGRLAPALKIAIMVSEREYETVVEHNGVCASACAVIWLSGKARRMLPGSRIGLHSARTNEEPTSTRSDFGTIQMTNYLHTVGKLPETIISFIEKTESKDMHFIGVTEATELGLLEPPHPLQLALGKVLGRPQKQIIGNQTWITMETVQCGSTRIVVWVNPNDPTNNYYGVTGDPFKGNRVQNLVINFAAGETFLSGKRCTMLQLGSIN